MSHYNPTLVLNADAQPMSMLPISSISWQEAIKFVFLGAAEPLHTYDDWDVHSPSTTIKVPSVIIFKDQVRVVRSWAARDTGGLQKHLVFLRDMYVCQYCNETFTQKLLTIDHVLPRYYGGKTTWDNVVAACSKCNHRRGHDRSQQPINKPYRPTYGQLLKNLRKFPVTFPSPHWNYYLGWDESRIRLADPKNGKIMNEHFVDFGIQLSLHCN